MKETIVQNELPDLDDLDLDDIETRVDILRPIGDDYGLLRQFSAAVVYHADDGEERIGQVDGLIGWSIVGEDLWRAADAISSEAEGLATTAVQIVDAHDSHIIEDVLLIDLIHLDERWRGHRLTGTIIADLMDLLRLDSDSTVVVLKPEPQRPAGGPIDDGATRNAAMSKLKSAYRAGGLEPWKGGDVWWRPLT